MGTTTFSGPIKAGSIREVINEIKLEEAKIATRENAIANSAPQVSVAT